ncbi:amidohydrolase [Dactylosporangium sp. NPDC000521]|uniref:amidohydrolase n=1 Tax=Dactylosporangium sp. NPDC000521 TaxID=3363975 RepID=UPI0036BBC15D
MSNQPADLLLTGGRVVTLDRAGTVAQAVAVSGATIRAAGSSEDLAALAGPATRVVDLAGRTVIPGLIDSHCHFEDAGMDRDTVPFDGVTTMAEALRRIAAKASALGPGSWVRGQIWNPVLQLAERRAPTRHELDVAASGRPVFLPMGHSAAVSTAALASAGLDEHTRYGEGIVAREPSGHPSGLLIEDGVALVARVVPPWTDEQRSRQLLDAMAVLNSWGITSVVGGAMTPRDVDLLAELARHGRSSVRVAAMLMPTGELNPSVDLDEWSALLHGRKRASASDWLIERGVKLQLDGGMTLGTAATREAYDGRPDYRGELIADPRRFTDLVRIAHRHDWPVGVHAVGDAAIDLALDTFERIPAAALPAVLIHASLIQPDQAKRAAALGVMVAAQTPFLWKNSGVIAGHLGRQRAERAVPLRTLVDTLGMDGVAAGTDYPINGLNPFQNLYAMTTRRDLHGGSTGAEQAVSRSEALRLYTMSGAAHTGEQGRKGAITPGRLADLVVLDTDPLTADDAALLETRPLLTIAGGRVVFDVGHELS